MGLVALLAPIFSVQIGPMARGSSTSAFLEQALSPSGSCQGMSSEPMLKYRYTVARLAPMIFPISAGASPRSFNS